MRPIALGFTIYFALPAVDTLMLKSAAVLGGGHPIFRLKAFHKLLGVPIPAGKGDFLHRQLGAEQKLLGVTHANL